MSAPVAFRLSRPAVVGREPELESLAAVVAQARGGEPAIVLVTGEAGIGKTRLTAQLERRAADDGVRVLHGDCIELGAGDYPYAPVIAALRGLAGELAPLASDA